MIKAIWKYLLGAEQHMVDSIVADFNGVVARLKASAEHHMDEAVKASGLSSHYAAVAQAADDEAARAKVIAANVEALITFPKV